MPFDLHSPAKTAVILYDKLGLPCAKETGKGARSVAQEALREIEGEHEAPGGPQRAGDLAGLHVERFVGRFGRRPKAEDRLVAGEQAGLLHGHFTRNDRRPHVQSPRSIPSVPLSCTSSFSAAM